MDQRDYFVVGCKLFGIWCLLWFLFYFFAAFPGYFTAVNVSDDMTLTYRLTRFFGFLKPVILLILAFYLIKSGKFLHDLAYPRGCISDLSSLRDRFVLGLKLLGLYLIAVYIPRLLEVLSRLIIYRSTPAFMASNEMLDYVLENAAPTVAAIILGFYLVKSGEVFIQLGFKAIPKEDKPPEDENPSS